MFKSLYSFVMCAAFLCAANTFGGTAPLDLRVIHLNDWDQMTGKDGQGGAARLATVVLEARREVEAKGGLTIVTFGGDMISPSLLSRIDRGAHMINLSNAIGFDVAVIGNHEFDFGPEILQARLAESDVAWLVGNVNYQGKSGFPGTEATMMFEKNGYKIGFLGLLTPDTAEISLSGEQVSFLSPIEAGLTLAKELKTAGADIIIALTHEDLSTDFELLRKVETIDLILGGHDHLLTAWYNGRQAIMKSGFQGRHVGVLDIRIDRVAGPNETRLLWTPNFALRTTIGIEENPALATKVSQYEKRLDQELGVVIGETATELDSRVVSVRSGETAFGNLVADALRTATESDIGLTNGGGIRGDKIYLVGTPITRKIIFTELPFGNKTVKLRLTGDQVKEALENGVSQVEEYKGKFPQVSGLSFSYDAGKPAGSRVTRVIVGDTDLVPDKLYTLATNDFLAKGGDGYTVFQSGEMLLDARHSQLMAVDVIDYIANVKTIPSVIEGRVNRED